MRDFARQIATKVREISTRKRNANRATAGSQTAAQRLQDRQDRLDRRRGARFADQASSSLTIICDANEMSVSGRTLDVTESGLGLWSPSALEVGSVVRCSLAVGRLTRVTRFVVRWRRRAEDGWHYGMYCPEGGSSRSFLRQYVMHLLTGRSSSPWLSA